MNIEKFLLGRLKGDLSILRDKENYHENFMQVINRCATAELELYVLLNARLITRSECDSYSERIQKYKAQAVKTHCEFLINSLEQTKMQFSPRMGYNFDSKLFTYMFWIFCVSGVIFCAIMCGILLYCARITTPESRILNALQELEKESEEEPFEEFDNTKES